MNLFPYVLVRLGGLSFDKLADYTLWEEDISEITFNQQLALMRVRLQQFANHPILQNGLVLSAPSLLNRIPSFQKRTPEQFRKKERQTERTLMQFLTRIITKTSPFSTFNQIGILSIANQHALLEKTTFHNRQSHIRVNNYFTWYALSAKCSDCQSRRTNYS